MCVRPCAVGAATPVHDLGFIDLESLVVGRGQAGRVTHRTVDVNGPITDPADQVMMVVTDPGFVPSRRTGRLDATDKALVGHDPKGVIDCLTGDRADLTADKARDVVGGAVGPVGHRPQDRQSLRGDLHSVPTQERGQLQVRDHTTTITQILD